MKYMKIFILKIEIFLVERLLENILEKRISMNRKASVDLLENILMSN